MTINSVVSNQDFELLKSLVKKTISIYGSEYNFDEPSIAFEFFILEKLFNLQEDEIIESITDTCFQNKIGRDPGPDRGIDAIKIDEENKIIHLFNFKYTSKTIDRIRTSHFEGAEIDKVLSFISDLYQKDVASFSDANVNSLLKEKVEEIWRLNELGLVFNYKIHLVANIFQGLVPHEENRLLTALSRYGNQVSFDYILVQDVISKVIQRVEKINAKFRALNKNFFDKSDSGRRALIIEILAIDLLRIVSNDLSVRENPDINTQQILSSQINEGAFSDNVRLYLKEKTNVNQNIIDTVLSDEDSQKIFFYNNGITITCEKIGYQGERNPVIHLSDLQVVNGGQTIHALMSAFRIKQEGFDKITLLCKIFETTDSTFKNKIAEYTNSQNPVSDRDIRSIDTIQIKLEKDFEAAGYYYCRKKSQHEDKDKSMRVDAEKLGQVLMAYSLEMPAEAKNRKSLVFGERYNDIFNSQLLANEALFILSLYKDIESKKIANKKNQPYLLHASYYLMFFIKKIAQHNNIISGIELYEKAVDIIEQIISKEKKRLGEDYSDAVLFKSNRPKEYLSALDL